MAPNKKSLSTWSLVMINVIAIDSLRSLPFGAHFGWALIPIYLVGMLVFLLPTALVSAQLASHYPNRGGVYAWVREAFGGRMGFMVIWAQWVYNIIWYPTILAFITTTGLQVFAPSLAHQPVILLAIVCATFWLATALNAFGMRWSSKVSSFGAIWGTMLPMLVIIALGAAWLCTGHASATPFHASDLTHVPLGHDTWPFWVAVIFGLVGMEMSAVHADEVKDPQRAFPRAIGYSCLVIGISMVLSSLALVWVLPVNHVDLLSGLVDAFDAFLVAFHIHHLQWLIALLIILGGFSSVTTWIIGPTRGVYQASLDGMTPKCWSITNRHGVPWVLLLVQGAFFMVACSCYLLMPSFSAGYVLLTNMTAQLALWMYIMMLAANLKLMLSNNTPSNAYRMPGGNAGQWLISGLGLLCCMAVIYMGFVAPDDVHGVFRRHYTEILIVGMVINLGLPYWIAKRSELI